MERNRAKEQYFTKALMRWHTEENTRTMPWKEEKDPYKIWLSEIILQQTRTEQGLPYYLNFINSYPTISDLANASDEDVFRLWQGLGYYNRCKNMLATARYIAKELNGSYPDKYDDILSLKGVGPYTAAAIASFAFGLPHAVVDGNVYRVLSRYFGIDTPIDSTEGKKLFHALAQYLLDVKDSAGYNQAIMDLGATVCKPASPICAECPLRKECVATNSSELISLLPVKSKKVKVNRRYFHYILFFYKGELWVKKRSDKDIWQNLHEFYLIEAEKELDRKEIAENDIVKAFNITPEDIEYEGALSQRLTHRIIASRFFSCEIKSFQKPLLVGGKWVKINELQRLAYPKTIVSFLEKKSYF